MKRFFKTISIFSIVGLLSVVGYYYQMQEKLIFKCKRLDSNYQYDFETPFEEVNLSVGSGESINCLHFFHENPKGVVLYLHGQGKNLSYWGHRANKFVSYGYDVFVIDYRGYGKSTDNLTEKNLMIDSSKAYEYLKDKYNESDIIVHGVSLGTAMASYVNTKYHPKMCILVSPYYNMIETAYYNRPILPRFVLKVILKYHLRTDSWIAKSNSPLHIFHGTEDKLVPYFQSEMIMDLVKEEKFTSNLYTLEGYGHNNIDQLEAYKTKVTELLEN